MNVNFFVTCIGDALKSRMARDSVLLLEKLGCRVNFPEKQGCCGQPAFNSGYIKEAIPGMKNLVPGLEDNDVPIISPGGLGPFAGKRFPTYLADEPQC
ncbi:(Fe-S)-binding protein, partial [Campylobacter jejuni]|nr:(Fe-S)-binding protein [Campylobacter jejuni]